MNSKIFLVTKVNIERNGNVFVIKRMKKFTEFVFVGTLFGSVLGIMGSFAFAMGLSEMSVEVIRKRALRKVFAETTYERRFTMGYCSCEDQFTNKTISENGC